MNTSSLEISHVLSRIESKRTIEGISAMLLPFDSTGKIDFEGFAENLQRTHQAGLAPAVNMDTGYTNLISAEERTKVLSLTQQTLDGARFIAGAFIEGMDGDPLHLYKQAVSEIQEFGGTPILFQSTALKSLDRSALVSVYKSVAAECTEMLGFELGEMFASFGQIYDLDTMRELMQIPQLKGAKHSSLNRELEWQRLALRDKERPEFKIYTGNDLAIDLVCSGSDYLLGLSAFCPEAFALRDRLWKEGDSRFYGLNDLIQYLGFFAFRSPVPAYKHTCAQFLKMRGRIAHDQPHPEAALRPDSDREVLRDISERLDEMTEEFEDTLPKVLSEEKT